MDHMLASNHGPGGIAADELKQFFARLERLEEDKAGVANDIKEVYAEAKSRGYDPKIIRKIIALRKKKPYEREEEAQMLELYLSALGE